MYTCRATDTAGTPYLPASRANDFAYGSVARLASFCAFVLKDKHRALFIYQIHISAIDSESSTPNAISRAYDELARVLELAKNIEILHIRFSDLLLANAPHFPMAFSSLKKVKELLLHGVGAET